MKNVGASFAWRHMEQKGWRKGEGLGRNSQGMTDALKPKLKFDQHGMGHNRAEEFEFHWWDHVFNSAAKGVSVDDTEGEVIVKFKGDKSEISAKKLRRKMQKEMRSKLYSHFVKSGTLEGGVLVEEEQETKVEEVKDLSKIKTLTDDELMKACGGRTAHKGARHGQNMTAKLSRIEEADRKYLEDLQNRMKRKENPTAGSSAKKKQKLEPETDVTIETAETDNTSVKKKKKKKKSKDIENPQTIEESVEVSVTEVTADEPGTKSKKKKKKKDKVDATNCDIESEVNTEQEICKPKKSKKKKQDKHEMDDPT